MSLTTWQRWCPHPAAWAPPLTALEAYLSAPEVAAALADLDEREAYPAAIVRGLRDRGLADLCAGGESGASPATPYQISSLSEMLARATLSLTVTAGVTQFALLPIYVAADRDQTHEVLRRIRAGASASMLLTEIDHGSNLLRNQTRAERGRLSRHGMFEPVNDPDAAFTHYRLTGEKHLINGGAEHDLLMVFARTRTAGRLGDFTFLCVERQAGVETGERWRTLPIRAADISTVRFDGAIVPARCVIGREGDGFRIAQQALAFGRCGPAAAAVGLSEHARRLTVDYARARDIYGAPLARLGAIAEHLIRMAALEALAVAMSIKQLVMLNLLGSGGAYYSAVAKFLCPRLAEEIVDEGRRVLSARAMLRKHAYERIGRDVLLLGIFDGSQHIMLNVVQDQLSRPPPSSVAEPLATPRRAYATPPQPLVTICRETELFAVASLDDQLRALSALPGRLPMDPLVELATGTETIVRALMRNGKWEADQSIRFDAAEIACGLEALVALVELGDPRRRDALGIEASRSSAEEIERDVLVATVAVGWFGARLAGRLRTLAFRAALAAPESLDAVEGALLRGQMEARDRLAAGGLDA